MSKNKIDKDLIINTFMNNSQDTIYIKDKNSAIILSSKAHSQLWGANNPEEVVGKTDFDYFPYEFAKMAYEEEQKLVRGEVPIIVREERLVKPTGEVRWLLSSKYPFRDRDGQIIGTWGTTRDITSQKKAEEELRQLNLELKKANEKLGVLSIKDSLSGLYNQGYLLEKLEESYNTYKNLNATQCLADFCLIMFDIDDFKIVNDSCGHLMGDAVIRRVSRMVLKSIGDENIGFRYGGDEFAILLLDTKVDQARDVASKLQDNISKTTIECRGNRVKITVSMGVAAFSECLDYEELIRVADERLYLSKHTGKNRIN